MCSCFNFVILTFQVSADEAQLMDTVVFEGPPLTEQQLWPAHCVQNSWGSKLHDDLKVKYCALYTIILSLVWI